MNAALRAVDRLFRVSGIVTLIALAATIVMLIAGVATWWMPFVAAHLTALIALAPLGLVLIAYGYREAGGVTSMIARHGIVAAALAVIAVSVTITLLEFSTNRDVRRVANIVTVSLVVLLVVHYLRWSRQALRG
ncbi:MAG: hypothetical protein WCQ48_03785 [Chloroflexota bacterium]